MVRSRSAFATAAVLALAASGCGPGQVGTVLESVVLGGPGAYGQTVSGEVRQVDGRRQRVTVRDRRGSVRAHFDHRTRVIAEGRRHDIRALRVGDFVTMQVQRDRRGGSYTPLVRIHDGHRAGAARLTRVDGHVGRLWRNRGAFELHTPDRQTVLVVPHRDLSRADRHRLSRLRTGDRVRVEGRPLDRRRIEMTRLR